MCKQSIHTGWWYKIIPVQFTSGQDVQFLLEGTKSIIATQLQSPQSYTTTTTYKLHHTQLPVHSVTWLECNWRICASG